MAKKKYIKKVPRYGEGGDFIKENAQGISTASSFIADASNVFARPNKANVGLKTGQGALKGVAAGAALGPPGMIAGALVGGLTSFIGGKKEKRAMEQAQQQEVYDNRVLRQNQSAATLGGYDTNGVQGAGYFSRGGNIPNPDYEVEKGEVVQGNDVQLEDGQQTASDIHEVDGEKHSNGGTMGTGGDRVFSDKTKISKELKTLLKDLKISTPKSSTYGDIAKKLGKEKGKFEENLNSQFTPTKNSAEKMLERIDSTLDVTFNDQEMRKAYKEKGKMFKYGGNIPKFPDGGGLTSGLETDVINTVKKSKIDEMPYITIGQGSNLTRIPTADAISYITSNPDKLTRKDWDLQNPANLQQQLNYDFRSDGTGVNSMKYLASRSVKDANGNWKTGNNSMWKDASTTALVKPQMKYGGRIPKYAGGIDLTGIDVKEKIPKSNYIPRTTVSASLEQDLDTAGGIGPQWGLRGLAYQGMKKLNNLDSGDILNAGNYLANLGSINKLNTDVKRQYVSAPSYNYTDRSDIAKNQNQKSFRNLTDSLSGSSRGVNMSNVGAAYAATLEGNNKISNDENLRKDSYDDKFSDKSFKTDYANSATANEASDMRRSLNNEKYSSLPLQARNAYMKGVMGNKLVKDTNKLEKRKMLLSALTNDSNGVITRGLESSKKMKDLMKLIDSFEKN